MSQRKVIMYSKQGCGPCRRAKAILESRGITPEIRDITYDYDAQVTLAELTGMRTLPQVFIEDELVGGASDLERLAREGVLDDILAGQSSD